MVNQITYFYDWNYSLFSFFNMNQLVLMSIKHFLILHVHKMLKKISKSKFLQRTWWETKTGISILQLYGSAHQWSCILPQCLNRLTIYSDWYESLGENVWLWFLCCQRCIWKSIFGAMSRMPPWEDSESDKPPQTVFIQLLNCHSVIEEWAGKLDRPNAC